LLHGFIVSFTLRRKGTMLCSHGSGTEPDMNDTALGRIDFGVKDCLFQAGIIGNEFDIPMVLYYSIKI